MSWNRSSSTTEQLMVEVLKEAEQPLLLEEVVSNIRSFYPDALTGKTPKNSLYSIIYRREKRRNKKGLPPLFITNVRGGATYYSINPEGMEHIGERITGE